jgi:hypothetical protein
MDISKIKDKDFEEGAWLDILDPITNQPSEDKERIKVLGIDSSTYRKAQRKISNRRLQVVGRRGGRCKITAEEIEAENLELLVSCVQAWEGFTENKQELECTSENVRRLFELAPWIKEQVDDFIGDRSGFLSRS